MVVPLSTDSLNATERAHLARFFATSFAQELREDAHSWRIVNWPRRDGFPARFTLRNEQLDEAQLIFWDATRYTETVMPSPSLKHRPDKAA